MKIKACCTPENSGGFTLIEFMIVITILGIMISIAAPSFATWIRETRLIKSSEALNGALVQARNEALRIQSRVSLCRTGNVYGADPNDPDDPECFDNVTYNGEANVAKDWSYGWLIYSAQTVSVAYDSSDPSHTLLAAVEGGEADKLVTIRSNAAAQNFVTYGADGRLDSTSPVFAVCDDRDGGDAGTHGYRISFSATGRAIMTDFQDFNTAPSCNP